MSRDASTTPSAGHWSVGTGRAGGPAGGRAGGRAGGYEISPIYKLYFHLCIII